ncbi:SusC/RagA family TonB-linked outer membrane protein [Pararcticibacter amylolyticus]|uniref:SusC/RagA family TonB-linked outer membrane protein n=1 Tax=Pararcticibacter amylolyticus TaxID=2173175 RepID=A0A2U2PIV0_9SPHI|nr:TonB-dependent receptor [Pararcticibacter amylolyticus]PWG81325.1 SusC/RagA family TonB-linked outer membrane protein [Pararcticibacter amylolyticus]
MKKEILKESKSVTHNFSLRKRLLTRLHLTHLIMLLLVFHTAAQQRHTVKGTVLDQQHNSVIGATVTVKGTSTRTLTDVNGKFSIVVPSDRQILVVSYVGMHPQEVDVKGKTEVRVTMRDDAASLEEVVIVGYGTQKKASVVAAVAQTTGKVLERAGGVSSIGAALTGNVPGVVTTASTGMPGDEDPRIVIRGRSTWNNNDPLILVDGIERPMTSVDIGSVESVSVLKDASATAVFGVRGANGVILITTKRGREGQASVRGTVNNVVKVPSKLPGKYDAYDALRIRNEVIEYELALRPESWNDYLPQDIINKYRYPADQTEAERYPNVNWDEVLFKDYAMSHNANLNISGGTSKVKYFASADYLYEGDLFRTFENDRGYKPGYGFNRLNMRSNLDFQLSKSTILKTNLSGSRGVKKMPWGASNSDYSYWISAYSTAPDVFMPQYSDGTWGYHAPNVQRGLNSARILAVSGVSYTTTNRITTDFTLDQDLASFVKGLNFKGTIALDNSFIEGSRGVNDLYNDTQAKWIDPETGKTTYQQAFDATNRFDFQNGINWATVGGTVQDWLTYRRLFYQAQLNYSRTLGVKHNVTAMGLFNRNQYATGSEIPFNREDWVFRATYNYANKYILEYNGSYNGSSKFGPENRFAFFSSGGLGWTISEEKFMKPLTFVDNLKIRGSYGEIGDDSGGARWLYLTQWAYGGQTKLGVTGEGSETSPYVWYRQSALGNPDVRWEKVKKMNVGADFSFFKGFISGKFDFFKDRRSDILLTGDRRAIPSYYGVLPPIQNLGIVENKGYELELAMDKKLNPNWHIWANMNYTRAKDKVIEADDASLLPDYQKRAGKQISQTYSHVSAGYYNTWDQLYASTIADNGDEQKLPGNYHILDYNADGVIDAKDNIPYAFPSVPQHTFNATFGVDWKGFSAFVQFYGVNNVTRQVVFGSLSGQNHLVYDEGSYWSKDNTDGDVPLPRWLSTPSSYNAGSRYMFDGSYIRLKNAEIAYTFQRENSFVKRLGIASMRVFLNGNNLAVWTKMPDDRESNFAGTGWASQGAYPTVKRFNLGANIIF